MADVKALINDLNQRLNIWYRKIAQFFRFIGLKLKNFRNLTLGEQLSYSSVGMGLVLVITSLVLFAV